MSSITHMEGWYHDIIMNVQTLDAIDMLTVDKSVPLPCHTHASAAFRSTSRRTPSRHSDRRKRAGRGEKKAGRRSLSAGGPRHEHDIVGARRWTEWTRTDRIAI